MRVFHLAEDEKFIDFYYELVSEVPGVDHKFLIQGRGCNIVHLRLTGVYRFVDQSYVDSADMVSDMREADVLIVHFMTRLALELILRVPDRVKVVWSGWGADYYHLISPGRLSLLGSETRKALIGHSEKRGRLASVISDLSHRVSERAEYFRTRVSIMRRWLPSIRRVDYFSAPIDIDFFMLKAVLGESFRASFLQINYGSVEKTFQFGIGVVSGDDILLGNSADPTNNHIDVMNWLVDLCGDRRVVVPLSYGNKEYRGAVVSRGEYLFGRRFLPLLNFMGLQEYNAMLARCSTSLMGHWRQQGLGNIGALMWAGSNVYLSNKNPLRGFLVEHGAKVGDLESLELGFSMCETCASDSDVEINRSVLRKIWGGEVVRQNAMDFFRLI